MTFYGQMLIYDDLVQKT